MSSSCELCGFRIIKIDCDITDLGQNTTLSIKVQDKMSCRKPLDPTDKTGLLEIETTITTDSIESFRIFLSSQAIFAFTESLNDFEETLKNDCYPIARKKINEAIKNITETMGVAPLDLNS